jgi:hypothetical protein
MDFLIVNLLRTGEGFEPETMPATAFCGKKATPFEGKMSQFFGLRRDKTPDSSVRWNDKSAGRTLFILMFCSKEWIPAFAGMTIHAGFEQNRWVVIPGRDPESSCQDVTVQ